VNEGRLTVHGWYYDILTGRIEQYDDQMRRFLPLLVYGGHDCPSGLLEVERAHRG